MSKKSIRKFNCVCPDGKRLYITIDYKEDLEDYIDNLKNFWNVSETKLVQFMLENDQNYYAWVPKEASIPNMYEVKIESVDVEEVL